MDIKLSLNYSLAFVALAILATGLTAAYGLIGVDRFLAEKVQAEDAARAAAGDMLDSLDRQEKAHARPALSVAAAAFEPECTRFERGMTRAEDLLRTPQARALLLALKTDWGTHRAAMQRYLTDTTGVTPRNVTGQRHAELTESYRSLKGQLTTLIDVIREAPDNPAAELQRVTRRFMIAVAVLTAMAVLGATWTTHRIDRTVLQPLGRVSHLVDKAVQGELHLRLSPERDKGVRQLALSCNRMLDSMQKLTEESRRRIRTERRLALTLIEALEQPTVALDPAGDVLLANAEARQLLRSPDGDDLLTRLRQCLKEGSDTLEHGGDVYAVNTVTPKEPKALDVQIVRILPKRTPTG